MWNDIGENKIRTINIETSSTGAKPGRWTLGDQGSVRGTRMTGERALLPGKIVYLWAFTLYNCHNTGLFIAAFLKLPDNPQCKYVYFLFLLISIIYHAIAFAFLPGSPRCKYTEQSSQGQAQQHPWRNSWYCTDTELFSVPPHLKNMVGRWSVQSERRSSK